MIGIFGGTFDPVHYGHIKPALHVKQVLNLSQLRFIPNRVPPHREEPWLPVEQRLQLLQCALKDYPGIVIDERELKRDGPSYMVDTLKSLKHDFAGESLCLIIGMDAFSGISQWFEWQSIFNYCHLVVSTRPGYEQQNITEQMNVEDYRFLADKITSHAETLSASACGKILLQSVPQLDISSTRIRHMLNNGLDPCQWMPEAACMQLMRYKIDDN